MPDELMHYGMPRRSGRYPWGSGENPYQRASSFVGMAAELRAQGLTEKQIAEYFGMTTTQLRARQADAKGYKREVDIANAKRLREKGMSTQAISERLGIPETTVRALLKPDADAKRAKVEGVRDILVDEVERNKYIDFGKGVETNLGVSSTQLGTAVQMLKDQGYVVHEVYVSQLGMNEQNTTMKVLCPPGTTKKELMEHFGDIRVPGVTIDPDGMIQAGIKAPVSIKSDRIAVRYGNEGGIDMDGVIELRRNVPDLDMGSAHYAQVRIAVDGTHYLKGMAIYADDLPAGVDIRFNTNKNRSDVKNKLGAMKEMKDTGDPTNPFGAVIKKQNQYRDANGKVKQGALNLLQEEGDWHEWSRSLPSQMLSKQRSSEAKKQLAKTRQKAEAELDEILSMTNPVVRRKLLTAYADSCDSKSVELKAAAYPRQAAQVILPIPKMRKNEIYAPNFKNGEKVALIRYPHGGTFEIPELTVNNKSKAGIAIMGKKAMDAVGIHPSVAERLSGADFDGDTVVVIPNNRGQVKTSPALAGLKGYDPKVQYKYKPGINVMKKGAQTQRQMGEVSNLITDMTIKGATSDEIARAVRHSMTVIDAAKHKLDWKQSAIDNGIEDLKNKYQRADRTDGRKGGASTLISRAKSPTYVPERRLRKASEGGPVDPKTGKLVYVEVPGSKKKSKAPALSLTQDAHALSSGRVIESIYADHSNAMKALANKARKAALEVKDTPYSPSAYVTYRAEVDSLRSKLRLAYKNKPRERQAQVLANAQVRLQKQSNPNMDKDDIKKASRVALSRARQVTGASKYNITISDREWEAIQKGAVRKNLLQELVDNTSADEVRRLALPHKRTKLTPAKIARAKALLNNHTTAEVAEALGVSVSTVVELNKEGD